MYFPRQKTLFCDPHTNGWWAYGKGCWNCQVLGYFWRSVGNNCWLHNHHTLWTKHPWYFVPKRWRSSLIVGRIYCKTCIKAGIFQSKVAKCSNANVFNKTQKERKKHDKLSCFYHFVPAWYSFVLQMNQSILTERYAWCSFWVGKLLASQISWYVCHFCAYFDTSCIKYWYENYIQKRCNRYCNFVYGNGNIDCYRQS